MTGSEKDFLDQQTERTIHRSKVNNQRCGIITKHSRMQDLLNDAMRISGGLDSKELKAVFDAMTLLLDGINKDFEQYSKADAWPTNI